MLTMKTIHTKTIFGCRETPAISVKNETDIPEEQQMFLPLHLRVKSIYNKFCNMKGYGVAHPDNGVKINIETYLNAMK